MSTQSEAQLEEALIKQLESNGYERVLIDGEADLILNLKTQLERLNELIFCL